MKDFKYYFRLCLTAPFWFLSISPDKKNWEEFKSGMINHKCTFNYSKPLIEQSYKYWACEHFGCNIVTMKDQNGNWSSDI